MNKKTYRNTKMVYRKQEWLMGHNKNDFIAKITLFITLILITLFTNSPQSLSNFPRKHYSSVTNILTIDVKTLKNNTYLNKQYIN